MSSENERFLEQYKRLESVIRDTGTAGSVLEYEQSLDQTADTDLDKLKITRQIRNYLQHHPDSGNFITVTPQMTKFTTALADKIDTKLKKVKDIMIRQKAITLDATIKDAITALSKSKTGFLAVTDKDGYLIGVLSDPVMVDCIARKGSVAGKIGSMVDEAGLKRYLRAMNIGAAVPDGRAENIYTDGYDVIIVMDKDRKYKGIIKGTK